MLSNSQKYAAVFLISRFCQLKHGAANKQRIILDLYWFIKFLMIAFFCRDKSLNLVIWFIPVKRFYCMPNNVCAYLTSKKKVLQIEKVFTGSVQKRQKRKAMKNQFGRCGNNMRFPCIKMIENKSWTSYEEETHRLKRQSRWWMRYGPWIEWCRLPYIKNWGRVNGFDSIWMCEFYILVEKENDIIKLFQEKKRDTEEIQTEL